MEHQIVSTGDLAIHQIEQDDTLFIIGEAGLKTFCAMVRGVWQDGADLMIKCKRVEFKREE